jgi:hypothetical protein
MMCLCFVGEELVAVRYKAMARFYSWVLSPTLKANAGGGMRECDRYRQL